MTIEQAIRVVAERDTPKYVGLKKRGQWYRPNAKGYTLCECYAGRYILEEAKKHEYLKGDYDEHVTIQEFSPPDYARSTDALRPVLAKLTEEERRELVRILAIRWPGNITRNPQGWAFHLLTLDPEPLCLAVAEAIEACKVKG